jgi:hypothetical protein
MPIETITTEVAAEELKMARVTPQCQSLTILRFPDLDPHGSAFIFKARSGSAFTKKAGTRSA